MTVDKKIKESEFFFQKIKDHLRSDDIEYYLSAFLCSTRSIPFHLLQDYDEKFGFNIPVEEREFEAQFREKLKGNHNAEKFISFYDRSISNINNDEIGRFMWRQRNITIHRSNDPFVMVIYDPRKEEILPLYFQITSEKAVRVDYCSEKFLTLMKNMVSHTHTQFP